MTTWVGQDGSFHDSEGDGPATLSVDDEEIATTGEFAGWTEPFTDWNGELLEGMGQYYVWNITDPWEPADFPAIPFPPASSEFAPEPPPPAASAQPESPLDTPAAPHAPTPPHFGPPGPGPGTKRPRSGGAPSHHTPGIAARGTFAGFDFPFTDDNGHLLMDPHPSHRDWQAPMTYGAPVMTGWDTPLTDLEGQLLSGPGQYGTFTVENPYDHRTFNDVDLQSEQLEGNPLYYYTDANMAWPQEDGHVVVGDDASQFGQAFGSMLGTAAGDNSGSWGQAGASIASSIEQGSDSGDWGSAIASIAATTAKVAIPAIVKATQSSSSSSASAPAISPPSVSPSGTTTTPSTTTTTTPSTTTPSSSQTQKVGPSRPGPRQRDPARSQLIALLQKLAKQYGIPVGRLYAQAQQAQHQAQGWFA